MSKKSKHKGFKDWYEEDEWGTHEEKRPSKSRDSKRMTKQDKIKRARREKNKAKQIFFD